MQKETSMVLWGVISMGLLGFAVLPTWWHIQSTASDVTQVKNANLAQTLWSQGGAPASTFTVTPSAQAGASYPEATAVTIGLGTDQPRISGVTWTTQDAWPADFSVQGSGFGNPPASGSGATDLIVQDQTAGWQTSASTVAPMLGTWTNTSISITGWTGYTGFGDVFSPGDALLITVINPQTGNKDTFSTTYPSGGPTPVLTLSSMPGSVADGATVPVGGALTLSGQPFAGQTVTLSVSSGTLTAQGVTASSVTIPTDNQGQFTASYTGPSAPTAAITLTAKGDGGQQQQTFASEQVSVTLTQSAPQTAFHRFFNGQSVTLTATSDVNVSQFPGDAVQIYDETTGAFVGTATMSGTTATATVQGASTADTYVAVLGPQGSMTAPVAKSAPMTETWIDPASVASYLSVTATPYPHGYPGTAGNRWTYTSDQPSGYPDVWANEDVGITAQAQNVYVPKTATLSIEDVTTGTLLNGASQAGVNSLMSVTAQGGQTHNYAAQLALAGTTYTTATAQQNVEVMWLYPWSVNLTDAYSGGNVTLTAATSRGYPWQSGTENGLYQEWAYLYDETTGQVVGSPVTGNVTTASWTLSAATYSGNAFAVYVEPSGTFAPGTYPASANTPPVVSNTVMDGTPVITGVTWDTSTWAPSVTVSGTGFGGSAGNVELYQQVNATNGVWWDNTGTTGSAMNPANSGADGMTASWWHNTSIGLLGFVGYGQNVGWPDYLVPGDAITVFVENTQTGQTASFNTAYPSNAPMPSVALNNPASLAPGQSETISGTVTWQGQPLNNALVTLSSSGGSLSATSVTTNSSGQFSVTYTAPSGAGTETITASSLTAQASASVTVKSVTPTITGVSVNSSTWPPQFTISGTNFGSATSGEYVQLYDNTRGWQGGTSGSAVILTVPTWNNSQIDITGMSNYGGGSGTWLFAPGDSVTANVTNPQTGQSRSYTFTYPANAQMPVLTLSPVSNVGTGNNTTVDGTVTFGGQPLANQTVNLTISGGSLSTTSLMANSNGQFSTTYTAPGTPGTYTVTASADGQTATQNVTVADVVSVTSANTGFGTNTSAIGIVTYAGGDFSQGTPLNEYVALGGGAEGYNAYVAPPGQTIASVSGTVSTNLYGTQNGTVYSAPFVQFYNSSGQIAGTQWIDVNFDGLTTNMPFSFTAPSGTTSVMFGWQYVQGYNGAISWNASWSGVTANLQ